MTQETLRFTIVVVFHTKADVSMGEVLQWSWKGKIRFDHQLIQSIRSILELRRRENFISMFMIVVNGTKTYVHGVTVPNQISRPRPKCQDSPSSYVDDLMRQLATCSLVPPSLSLHRKRSHPPLPTDSDIGKCGDSSADSQ